MSLWIQCAGVKVLIVFVWFLKRRTIVNSFTQSFHRCMWHDPKYPKRLKIKSPEISPRVTYRYHYSLNTARHTFKLNFDPFCVYLEVSCPEWIYGLIRIRAAQLHWGPHIS